MTSKTHQLNLCNKIGPGAGRVLTYGGDAHIRVQSMLNKPPHDLSANLEQARKLVEAGCELVRFSVPDKESLDTLDYLLNNIEVPIVADIHFSHELAIFAIERGVAKVRINPGNIGGFEKTALVAEAAKKAGCAIRVGVNAGSTDRKIEDVAREYVDFLENDCSFSDLVVSIKSSDLYENVKSNLRFAKVCPHIPLHLGITEAGCLEQGLVKSSAGLALMLNEGIGNSIRYSLTDDPIFEVRAGYDLLNALGLRSKGVQIVSCPTCARTEVDMIPIAREVQSRLSNCNKSIRIAVMGCVVNGPGEAKNCDIGICCGKGSGALIKGGKIIKKVPEAEILDCLIDEIDKL